LIRQKKDIKRLTIVVVTISLIFISTVLFNDLSNITEENRNNENGLIELPYSSDLKINDIITSSGDNQDVRIYANNKSENLNNNQDFFEIPTYSTDDMFLTYGDLNFTFQNNFTTDYILEDDNALQTIPKSNFIAFEYNRIRPYSNIILGTGTDNINPPSLNNMFDTSNSTYLHLNATNGILNFTIKANFTDDTYTSPVISGNVVFNRTKILGMIQSLLLRLNLDANLTIQVLDYAQSTWVNITKPVLINSSLGIQNIKNRFINTNLNFINLTDVCYIRFIFERSPHVTFNGRFYNFDLMSTLAFDLPITNSSYVALECDLKGKETSLNGFYAWIRTLDLTEAANTHLNITLYRANGTLVRTDDNLRNVDIVPDYADEIDSQLFNYSKDNITYFSFDTVNTGTLNLSNYFITIKSNNSKDVYSLVSLPYFDYGDDGRTEHKLITTNDFGISWKNAEKQIDTTNQPYTSGQLDASSFKLNVTRGYMPSDFIVNGSNTLKIEDLPIENLNITSYPYNESSYLTWGIGRWNYNLSEPIEDNLANRFRINLTWDPSITKGFEFNVTYSINTFWVENASATYLASYDVNPEWVFRFTLDKNDPKFNNWTYIEFWYVYPNFMSAHNLTNPNLTEILWQIDGESILESNPSKFKIIVNESYSILDGQYTLNLTSHNFIKEMKSFINFDGDLLETNGFMYGDNISIGVGIQDHNVKAPLNGVLNATLFHPNGTRYPIPRLISSSGVIDKSILYYDFNNNTILNLTKDVTPLGEYNIGFIWLNGSAVGCKKLTIYIDTYDIDLTNLTYSSILKKNILHGEVRNKVFTNYTLLIASVNETTGISNPDFYPINNDDIGQILTYNSGGQQLPLLIKTFNQSENILNPNELVNFKTTIQNIHPFIPVDVKIHVKLVSYANEEWIMAENMSNTVNLNFSGHIEDTYEFDVNLTIPSLDVVSKIWKGVNAPVRLGGAKTVVTVYLDDNVVGTYEPLDYSLISNKTENDFEGNIIGMRITEDVSTRNILNVFERDECSYFPESTLFLVNVVDKNVVSSYEQFTNEFTLNLNSKFTNTTIIPNNPIDGQVINISSILTTEFEVALTNRNVSCHYYYENLWVEIGSDLTDSIGYISFLINTLNLEFENDLLLRLSWEGDSINGVVKNITVNVIQDVNNLSISIRQNAVQIYRNRKNSFTVTVNNFGSSDLRLFNISVDIKNNLAYVIAEINYLELNLFSPGDATHLIIEIDITNIQELDITFSITGQNLITGENVTVSLNSIFQVFDPPIFDYLIELFMFIMITIFALIWISAIIYSRRIKKRIEEPVEETRRQRRGRYVKVSELKKPTPSKKTPPKKAVETKESTQTTDLDSLLEERGLTDKDKKKNTNN
jgi:hypothetical protein